MRGVMIGMLVVLAGCMAQPEEPLASADGSCLAVGFIEADMQIQVLLTFDVLPPSVPAFRFTEGPEPTWQGYQNETLMWVDPLHDLLILHVGWADEGKVNGSTMDRIRALAEGEGVTGCAYGSIGRILHDERVVRSALVAEPRGMCDLHAGTLVHNPQNMVVQVLSWDRAYDGDTAWGFAVDASSARALQVSLRVPFGSLHLLEARLASDTNVLACDAVALSLLV